MSFHDFFFSFLRYDVLKICTLLSYMFRSSFFFVAEHCEIYTGQFCAKSIFMTAHAQY